MGVAKKFPGSPRDIDMVGMCVLLCYEIVLPGLKWGFRVRFRPDFIRESPIIGPPDGRRPAGGPIFMFSILESGRNLARKRIA